MIALIAATALWGVSFPLTKSLMLEQAVLVPGATSGFFSAWSLAARFLLGAVVLLPVIMKLGIRAGELRQGMTLAFWGGFGMWAQADGLAHTAASTSAFFTQGYCIFLPLWFGLRQRRWPAPRILVATLMVVAGGAWIAGVRPGNLQLGRGEWETLLAALLFTFQILALEDPAHAANRALPVTFVMFLGTALIFLPVAYFMAPSAVAFVAAGSSWAVALQVVALAVFSTVGAYVLMIRFQRGVTATEAGLIYCAEPVFTAVFVLFLPGWLAVWTGNPYANESWSPSFIGGGLLITAANVVMQWKYPEPVHAG